MSPVNIDIQLLTSFFMWCSIINVGILIFWSLILMFASDFVYKMQNMFLPIARESYNKLIFSFLGLFKLLFIVFNLVPYLVLLILSS